MDSNSRVFIAGAQGMVGSAIKRNLESKHYDEIYWVRRKNCDLRNRIQVDQYFQQAKPEYIFVAAAKVGGIFSNKKYPASYIFENLNLQCNVINEAYLSGVKKLLFLGSSCIYPKFSNQPIKENELFMGALEPTNESYAIAKIAGIKMCEAYNRQYKVDFRTVMPTNLYGPNDNFDSFHSHVISALILNIS